MPALRPDHPRRGQGLSEYSIGLAIVALAVVVSLSIVSGAVGGVFSNISSTIAGVTGGPLPSGSPVTPGTPGAPTNLNATPGDGHIDLSWTAPASDGGSPITGYTVTGDPTGSCTPTPATNTSCTVPGLTNGTSYTFTVSAGNANGAGPTAATAPTTPGAGRFGGAPDLGSMSALGNNALTVTDGNVYFAAAPTFNPDSVNYVCAYNPVSAAMVPLDAAGPNGCRTVAANIILGQFATVGSNTYASYRIDPALTWYFAQIDNATGVLGPSLATMPAGFNAAAIGTRNEVGSAKVAGGNIFFVDAHQVGQGPSDPVTNAVVAQYTPAGALVGTYQDPNGHSGYDSNGASGWVWSVATDGSQIWIANSSACCGPSYSAWPIQVYASTNSGTAAGSAPASAISLLADSPSGHIRSYVGLGYDSGSLWVFATDYNATTPDKYGQVYQVNPGTGLVTALVDDMGPAVAAAYGSGWSDLAGVTVLGNHQFLLQSFGEGWVAVFDTNAGRVIRSGLDCDPVTGDNGSGQPGDGHGNTYSSNGGYLFPYIDSGVLHVYGGPYGDLVN